MQAFDLPEPMIKPEAIAFSPDGRWLAVTERGRVFAIDTASGMVRTLWREDDTGFGYSPSGIGFTFDSRGVIVHHVFHWNSAIEVHDIETGDVLRDFALNRYEKCEVGPGGRLVYVAAETHRHEVEFVRWNPLTGEQLPAFARHDSHVQQLAVSANEKWLAGSAGDVVRLWNLSGKKLPKRATKQFHLEHLLAISLAISADGNFLAVGTFERLSGAAVRICEAKTGEWKLISTRERDEHRDLAFHPSRPVLAHRGGPGEVVFYDVASHTELKRYAWPLSDVRAISFAADGLRCAAAGLGKVVVWDVDV